MRGAAGIVEVLLVSAVVAVVLAAAFAYAVGVLSPLEPDAGFEQVNVLLCGKVLTLKNVGEEPVEVTGAWGVYYDSKLDAYYTEDLTAIVKGVLEPGEARHYRLGRAYGYVVLAVEDVRLPPVENSCVP